MLNKNDYKANKALERAIRALGSARLALAEADALSAGGVWADAAVAGEAWSLLGDVIAWAEREHAENARLLEERAWEERERAEISKRAARGGRLFGLFA